MEQPSTSTDAAAGLDDVAAHHEVISAARETWETVQILASLSAKAGAPTDNTRAQQLEFGKKIAQMKEKYKGAANAVGPGGFTPLLLVCMQGRADDVTALLALGADPTTEGDVSKNSDRADPDQTYKCTALMLAARDDRIEIIMTLFSTGRVDVNQASSDAGRTALFVACGHGAAASVKYLLAHNAIGVNRARDDNVTPFFMACQYGHEEIVELMLARDEIDVHKSPSVGATPFFIACQNEHAETVKLLLVGN